MEKIVKALQFLRIADENGNLSLTNVSLLITLGMVVMRPELTATDIATFVATVIGYQVKRFANPSAVPAEDATLSDAVKELQTKVTALQLAHQIRR